MASSTPSVTPSAARLTHKSFSARVISWMTADPVRLLLYIAGMIFILLLSYRALDNILSGDFTFQTFVRLMIFGLAQGSLYALVALGYTLVYGILGMINFAHGEIFMAGAFLGFFTIYTADAQGWLDTAPALALLLTLLTGMVASAGVAVLLERIAYRPLRGAPRLVPLITAIGASITIRELFNRVFGASSRSYPPINIYVLPGIFRTECSTVDGVEVCRGLDLVGGIYNIDVLGVNLFFRPFFLIIFLLAVSLMVALWFFVQRTKIGKAMRAVAEDKNTAALMGVNVDRVIVMTFILGAVLAGAAGVLFAVYDTKATPDMGFIFGLKAFTAAVLGGIGNIPGAMFGGLSLGVVESVSPSLADIDNQLADAISFSILILILIFRPTGLFGEVLAKKKA
jgi:branched-chain amino acid transport system permease protein